MYLEHFGLKEFPFSTSPDPRFYYPSAKHREALACLIYTVEQRKGFALISGEVGAGKTMLCRAALQRFGDGVQSAILCHTSITPTQFVKAIAAEFGLNPWNKTKIENINMVRAFLAERARQGRIVVLIIDEAQGLSADVLEEVRLLGNLETTTEKLMQTILVGQPELRRLVGQHRLRQLDQRIALKFHLGALTADDVCPYIDHRLEVAGGGGGIFTPGAKEEVASASGGVPRLVNTICDQALLQTFVSDQTLVTGQTIRDVVAEREGYYMDRPDMVFGEEAASASPEQAATQRARLRCPKCGALLTVYRNHAGKTGRCPGCRALLRVPPEAFTAGTGDMRSVPEADVQQGSASHDDYQALGTSTTRTEPASGL
jgi:general secretion pathway protein A